MKVWLNLKFRFLILFIEIIHLLNSVKKRLAKIRKPYFEFCNIFSINFKNYLKKDELSH